MIISYNVQWDAGTGVVQFELIGQNSNYNQLEYTVTNGVEGLTAGYPYMFRYRGLNKYGWGEYSEAATYLAADRPSQANPVTTSIENQYVKISWQYPIDSSSAVVEYAIEI